MLVMYTTWLIINRIPTTKTGAAEPAISEEPLSLTEPPRRARWFDLVDIANVDLFRDEHKDDVEDRIEDQERERRLKGRTKWFWKLYYFVA